MSKFSSIVIPDLTMLPAASQELIIRKFLPSELIPNGWSCQETSLIENIRTLYGASIVRIQMYGSPESMEKSLMSFMSFPGNQKYFQIQDSTFYKTNVFLFRSLGGKAYIYQDCIDELFFLWVPKIDTLPSLQKLAHNLLSYFLRTLKKNLTTLHEMVEFDEEFKESLMGIKLVLEKIMKTEAWTNHGATFAFDKKSDDELMHNINKIMRTEITAEMESEMRETVTMIVKDVPVKENISAYRNMLTWLHLIIRSFNDFITKNKFVVLSRSETVDSFSTSKILVRLFENDEEKVVMSHELLHAIKLEKLDVSGFEDKILAMPKLSAMSFREVFEMIPSNIFRMLEFIRIPLRNTTKEPYMIPTIDGSYCLSTYQFFMMILCDAIHVKKLFQGMKMDQWSHIMHEFYSMLVDILRDGNYFVTIEKYEETKQLTTAPIREITSHQKRSVVL
ncbi:hypothetical protein CAEBREN_18468 [Caenorhabditis brenneri]|uniref:DUF7809 domain-containing protein n=1 Tax=Caenorhabditis brenneri TaxID=135651 RepID=G0P0E2_CAEBE|nr:hypothetical protein CAEBREN_18468 [Caenorhabditis brenneri]